MVAIREAPGRSALWVALGLAFSVLIYFGDERHEQRRLRRHGQILDRLRIEKCLLSVDDIFVIAMIFGVLGVPALYQHRVRFINADGRHRRLQI